MKPVKTTRIVDVIIPNIDRLSKLNNPFTGIALETTRYYGLSLSPEHEVLKYKLYDCTLEVLNLIISKPRRYELVYLPAVDRKDWAFELQQAINNLIDYSYLAKTTTEDVYWVNPTKILYDLIAPKFYN
jgi:hypothetical protein